MSPQPKTVALGLFSLTSPSITAWRSVPQNMAWRTALSLNGNLDRFIHRAS